MTPRVTPYDGEPARHAARGLRQAQAARAATILGVHRITLTFQDRLICDTVQARLAVARLVRLHRPKIVFTTAGSGVHPDHAAVTDIVVHGVFYARLPKWEELADGGVLDGTEPHEIDRLFFGHCRMEPAWSGFDFAVDVSATYAQKLESLKVYDSVFSGDQASLIDKYSAEDRYVGSLVGAPDSTGISSGAAVRVSSTSGTNPAPGVVCRENADWSTHPVAPARVDRLKRRTRSRRCIGVYLLKSPSFSRLLNRPPVGMW